MCQNEADAYRLVQIPDTWASPRLFRPFKLDHRGRWEPYCCILFSTQPVQRQRHIELEHLLDREFLSRAIVGISMEVGAPVTVYAASAFEARGETRICWEPIEA